MDVVNVTHANANQNVDVAAAVVKMAKKKITEKTKISELLEINPEATSILFEIGMHCIGCPMAMQETIEDGCKAHGMTKKQIDELLKKLNEK